MEFGSDFHYMVYPKGISLLDIYPQSNLYASGRLALLDLAINREWNRLWVPSYFCEETLNIISRVGIRVCKYNATPFSDPTTIPNSIETEPNDGLLIVNYFGLFNERHFKNARCEIVEDHTHNVISNWALNSSADWCIASLRKILPIADGGMLWSPKKLPLPNAPQINNATENVMCNRFDAMHMKADYLNGASIKKKDFLDIFRKTEDTFGHLPISSVSENSLRIIKTIDITAWNAIKRSNWNILRDYLVHKRNIRILVPETNNDTPFSLTLLFKDKYIRDVMRQKLIKRSVYPAILWSIESNEDYDAVDFGNRMLSLHCDARYTSGDMKKLSMIIKEVLHEVD